MAREYAIPVHKAKPITNVTLKRLADRGVIERFQKGVYYRVKQTVFGKARPSEDILEAQLLTRRGNEIIGYETGFSLMNKLGLTTLVPKKREIATNAYRMLMSMKIPHPEYALRDGELYCHDRQISPVFTLQTVNRFR
jgi:predicted transcriptional regulator of viral defense system